MQTSHAQVLVDNGFYVLIDNHLNLDSTAVDNPIGWVTYWANLMASIVAMGPQYQNSVMADILNEPDSRGLTCVSTPISCQRMLSHGQRICSWMKPTAKACRALICRSCVHVKKCTDLW